MGKGGSKSGWRRKLGDAWDRISGSKPREIEIPPFAAEELEEAHKLAYEAHDQMTLAKQRFRADSTPENEKAFLEANHACDEAYKDLYGIQEAQEAYKKARFARLASHVDKPYYHAARLAQAGHEFNRGVRGFDFSYIKALASIRKRMDNYFGDPSSSIAPKAPKKIHSSEEIYFWNDILSDVGGIISDNKGFIHSMKEMNKISKEALHHANEIAALNPSKASRELAAEAKALAEYFDEFLQVTINQNEKLEIFSRVLSEELGNTQIKPNTDRLRQAWDDYREADACFYKLLNSLESRSRNYLAKSEKIVVVSGVAYVSQVSEEPEPSGREHPLGAGVVAREALKRGAELGEAALDVIDVADCVETVGLCYAINPAVDAAVDHVVLPVAEHVVAPVVVPVVKTGIAAGGKVGEMVAPAVGKGAELANEHLVRPAGDKLRQAFQEPARIAGEAAQTKGWGMPSPW
ncbi:MAG: hypothetical protein K1X66_05785 [Verrucomicrobiae bacterium]|nr:hypothetical protein [Verrucomicrobiae bacterium]